MKKITLSCAILFTLCIISTSAYAQKLTYTQYRQVRREVINQWRNKMSQATEGIGNKQRVTINGRSMPIHWSVYGNKPNDGRSLYISLHGGGSAPTSVNNQQWQNQWQLYQPEEGVYLCPRAPYDDWDMHFKPGLDEFYSKIIIWAVTHLDVNPNKVYLLGYSAGGDGVWRMAPRMADTWAAASMMAGHPGDVSLVNLRNTPFMIWCGALDAAYDRNKRCSERIAEMDALQRADRGGYIHEGHILQGKGHWMDGVDRQAIPWMAKFTRNPYPNSVVWRQEEVLHKHFYWLGVPQSEMEKGKEIRAYIRGNNLFITKCDYSHITIYLNDEMMNLDQPVTIYYKGKVLMKNKLERTRTNLERTIAERNDPNYAFPTAINLSIPYPSRRLH